MKSEIFLFFACGFCFNIVASFQQYRQGAYPKWTNQNYPPNQDPVYPLRQPNYGAPQPVVNYVQGPPEPDYAQIQDTNFPAQKHAQGSIFARQQPEQLLQQQVESQSDDMYAQPPSENVPQTYPEPSYLASPISPDRYENYGHRRQPSRWEVASPASPVYNNPSPQVSRQWPSHSTYQPAQPIPEESYPQPASYPHWQSNGYKAVQPQESYYGGTYDKQNAYNDQVQYTSNAQPDKEAVSSRKDSMVQEILASKPKVKDYLVGPHEARYILFYPNGTTEYVDVLDDDLIGKSKHFKSSDILEVIDYNEKVANNPKKSPILNIIPISTPAPENLKQNYYPSKASKNGDFLSHSVPNVPKETSSHLPLEDHRTKTRFNQEYEPVKKNKENHDEGSKISSLDKTANYNNHRHHPNNEPIHSQKHEVAPVHSPSVSNNNDKNDRNPSEPKTSHTNDKRHDNIPFIEENVKKPHNALPSYNYLPTNDKNSYNPSRYRQNNPSRVQNSNDDTIISANYVANPATYYPKPVDDPDSENKPTISDLPYHTQKPQKSDEINNKPTFKPPNPSDYEIFDNLEQPQDSYDDTSSVGQQYPEDDNPVEKNDDDDATDSSVFEQQEDIDEENTNIADAETEDTFNEMKLNIANAQDVRQESIPDIDSDNDDEKSIVDFTYTDTNPTSTAATDITTVSPVESASSLIEDSSTDIETTKTVDEEESAQTEKVDEKQEENEKPENETDKNEIDVDFTETLDLDNVEKYDEVYFFDVKLIDSYIERTSRTYMTKTNITVEDIEEVVWEHKGDKVPRKITTTKIIWNPGPGYARPKKTKPAQTEDTEDAEDYRK